jgi:hypothetical protein
MFPNMDIVSFTKSVPTHSRCLLKISSGFFARWSPPLLIKCSWSQTQNTRLHKSPESYSFILHNNNMSLDYSNFLKTYLASSDTFLAKLRLPGPSSIKTGGEQTDELKEKKWHCLKRSDATRNQYLLMELLNLYIPVFNGCVNCRSCGNDVR